MKKSILLALILVVTNFFLHGNTYYVSTSGNDSDPGNLTLPWETFNHAMGILSPGDSLIVLAGEYHEPLHVTTSGTDANWITIMAESTGAVTIDGDSTDYALLIYSQHHIIVDGFRFRNSGERAVVTITSADGQSSTGDMDCHDIIVRRLGVEGSCNLQNCEAFGVSRANNVLVEDCWVYGYGRYTFLVYGARDVTIRRVLARWDAWDGVSKPNDPRFAMGLYNSFRCTFENIIILDAAYPPTSGDKGGILIAGNSNGTTAPWESSDSNRIYGAIIANNRGGGISIQGGYTEWHKNILFENALITNNSYTLYTNSRVQDVKFNHITAYSSGGTIGSQAHDSSAVRFNNSIVFQNKAVFSTLNKIREDYNLLFNNSPSYNWGYVKGDSTVTVNPELMYLFDNETDAVMPYTCNDSASISGLEYRGAHLAHKYEDGVLTSDTLWPWPYEDLIHEDLCDSLSLIRHNRLDTNVARWCESGKTLTQYLWEILGNDCPERICNYAEQDTTTTDTVVVDPPDTTVTDTIVVDPPDTTVSGIWSSNEQMFSVYPNPSTGQIYVRNLSAEGTTSVAVYNFQGQQMEVKIVNGKAGVFQLDVSQLNKGVYFLNLNTTHYHRTYPIMLE